MEQADPLALIAYLSIRDLTTRRIGEFHLDPDIRLPVELPPGGAPPEISPQAIVTGMLKVLAYQPGAEHADYYRRLILAVQPDIKEEFTQAGIVKFEQGELDLAREIFLSLAGLFPRCGLTRNNLALVYERLAAEEHGEAAEALGELAFTAYKEAVAAEPELPACHLNFAGFYLKRGNPAKAREHLERFLEYNRDPRQAESARQLHRRLEGYERTERACAEALDAIQLGRETAALELLAPVTAEHPGLWKAWFLQGWANRRLKRFPEARRAFERALAIDPRQPDLLNELAICLLELGQPAESRRLLEESHRLDPANTKIMSNLAVAALKLGDEDGARRLFRAVLDQHPDDPLARKYLE